MSASGSLDGAVSAGCDARDPAMGGRIVAALSGGAVVVPGFDVVGLGSLRATYVGAGESYAAWRVERLPADTPGDELACVLFRVPHRPVAELPFPMAREFAAASLVPPSVGTHGLLLGEDDGALGVPFLVTTWAPGSVRPGEAWTDSDLAAHAVTLARLHTVRPPAGMAGAVDAPEPLVTDLSVPFDDAMTWWRTHHPEVVDTPGQRALLKAVQAHVEAQAWAFEGHRDARLCHGDGIAGNVVLARGSTRLIDWEWAEFSDPARDLALLGGCGIPPWSVPMDAPRLAGFVATYAGALRAFGDDVDERRLEARRSAWELYDLFTCNLYRIMRSQREPDAYPHGLVEAQDRRLREHLGLPAQAPAGPYRTPSA